MAPPPFRAEQVGSLLRPDTLLKARQQYTQFKSHQVTSPDQHKELLKLEKGSIADVVKQQIAEGIHPITSGEYERNLFYDGFYEKLGGMEVQELPLEGSLRTNFPTTAGYKSRGHTTRVVVVATGKITYKESPYLEEWEYLRSLVPQEKWHECKMTISSVTFLHMELKPGTAYLPSAYSSDEAYFADLSSAFRQELRTLYDAGLRSIQVDDPQMTYFCNPSFIEGCEIDGVDPDALLEMYIKAHNDSLKEKPSDMHVGIHLCRGNAPEGMYFSSGSYEAIARKLFNELHYDTFYLEYDTDRAGGFEPLRYLPTDKRVILGVVTTKSGDMEVLKTLKARVMEAAEHIAKGQGRTKEEALQQLGVSPQCGFASATMGKGVGMTTDVMWEKLRLVRELAREIWPGEI